MNVQAQIQELKKLQPEPNGNSLLSYGVKTQVKSLIEESNNTLEVGMVLRNETGKDVTIAIGAVTANEELSVIDKTEILSQLGADTFLDEGTILTTQTGDLTAESIDQNHPLSQMIRFARKSPFRFTRFVMTSSTLNGDKEASNYTTRIKTMFFSPFEDTTKDEFSLRNIVKDRMQENLLSVDFQTQTGLNPIIGTDNFMTITVKAGTVLTISAGIGAQVSLAQYLYRRTKVANKIMSAFRNRLQ